MNSKTELPLFHRPEQTYSIALNRTTEALMTIG